MLPAVAAATAHKWPQPTSHSAAYTLMQITDNNKHSLQSRKEYLSRSQAGMQLKVKLGLQIIITSEVVWGNVVTFTHIVISSLYIDK
jgi:hypothetical protein